MGDNVQFQGKLDFSWDPYILENQAEMISSRFLLFCRFFGFWGDKEIFFTMFLNPMTPLNH